MRVSGVEQRGEEVVLMRPTRLEESAWSLAIWATGMVPFLAVLKPCARRACVERPEGVLPMGILEPGMVGSLRRRACLSKEFCRQVPSD